MSDYNPLTNSGYCKDETYQKATSKPIDRHGFFYRFCNRIFKLANKELIKRYNIKILKIVFWDMETGKTRTERVDKFE